MPSQCMHTGTLYLVSHTRPSPRYNHNHACLGLLTTLYLIILPRVITMHAHYYDLQTRPLTKHPLPSTSVLMCTL